MPYRLTFGVFGEQQVDRTLARVSMSAEDMRPAWDALAVRFQNMERRQFRSEGSYGGERWAPLSAAYAARKMRLVGPQPILVFSGDLRTELTEQPFGVDVREPAYAIFGSSLPYAPLHAKGGGNLPRRPPIEVPESERKQWVKIAQRYIVTGEARVNP